MIFRRPLREEYTEEGTLEQTEQATCTSAEKCPRAEGHITAEALRRGWQGAGPE